MVITVDTPNLVRRRGLISHLLVSHIFLIGQIVCLPQFNPDQLWLSLPLVTGDAAYRIFQCAKINYYCCYVDLDGNHGYTKIPIQESSLNKDITTRCFVPSVQDSQHCILYRRKISFTPIAYTTRDTTQKSPIQQCEHSCSELPQQDEEPRRELTNPPIQVFYNQLPSPPPLHDTPLLFYDSLPLHT